MNKKVNLLDYTSETLKTFFTELGEKPFRATQVIKWMHQKSVHDFADMSNVSKSLREKLAEIAEIKLPEIVWHKESTDGTHKWLLRLHDGNCIEAVFIPEDNRGTLCVSSQVGCALDCTFCSTARQGFNRNLTIAEIIGQVWIAKNLLQPDPESDRVVTNVVMMGMGEPLLNFENVIGAMELMLDDNAYGLSKRRVTLSTSGVVPALNRLKDRINVSLAISLHAANDELRNQLVPINRKYNIEMLLESCKNYIADKANREKITIEYTMLAGINDTDKDAHDLAKLLKDVPCKINLIPFNPFPNTNYTCSSNNRIHKFRDILTKHKIIATIRKTRGDDIDAACGQLAGQFNDKSRREVHFARIENSVQ